MPIVFACIAPHGGHLMLDNDAPTPIPQSRDAMAEMRREFTAARPESIALITPHGIYLDNTISLGVTPTASGKLDDLTVSAKTDTDLAISWAYHAAALNIPVTPVTTGDDSVPFPLDWGSTIPLALLDPSGQVPVAVACQSRALSREQLIDFGEALVRAADDLDLRIALIVSADQGHGHAANGPYGFAPESAQYDQAMIEAIKADDIPRLLEWEEAWIEAALADSYWQTLSLIGVQKHVPLKGHFLSYEVDHYFGLLCAVFTDSN